MFRTTGVQSAKYIKKKRRKMILRLCASIVFICLLVYASILLASWKKLAISTIVVQGNSVVSSEDITKVTEALLQGNYAFFYPRRNIFLYPKRTISATLRSSFNRIESISLWVDASHTLHIDIVERKPFGLWCGNEIPEVTDTHEQCSYLDSSAYIFENAPHFSSDVYLTYYGMPVDAVHHVYQSVGLFNDLTSFAKKAQKMNLEVSGVAVIDNHNFELYIQNTDATSTDSAARGTIMFNDNQPFSKTLENLSAFINEYRDKNKGELPSVDYIDLRYGNNIVYKFR